MKPNFQVILIDELRYAEFGAGGHPYMQTPHFDRLDPRLNHVGIYQQHSACPKNANTLIEHTC